MLPGLARSSEETFAKLILKPFLLGMEIVRSDMTPNTEYDVLILGTGIGGGMLGSILARHGLNVLMLDSESHPRFAIGEATTPDTNFRLKLLSLKYDLPEIAHLSAFHSTRDYISPACGVKRAFSFLYQREGKDLDPMQTHQYPTLAPPMG